MNPKLKYFLSSVKKSALRQGFACPSCGQTVSLSVSRKYVFTTLRRCTSCHLLFRAPTTSPDESAVFYQTEYQEGFTTDLPSRETLDQLKCTSFAKSPKDFTDRLMVLQALGVAPGSRLCDFGCSWGYGSWQFTKHGLQVQAFELSRPRVDFAKRELEVDVVSDLSDLQGPFDVFFSSHVLEHVSSVKDIIDLSFRLLRNGGFFVGFTPNGSLAYRNRNWKSWQSTWGMKHPNHLDDVFYRKTFAAMPYYVSSSPYNLEALQKWAKRPTQDINGLDGTELMAVVQSQVV